MVNLEVKFQKSIHEGKLSKKEGDVKFLLPRAAELCIIGPMTERLLLLSCCAPCSIGVIKKLKEDGTDFTVLFYNPNIRPVAEYQRRLAENKRVCAHFGVPFIDLPYEPEVWNQMTVGLESEPERGKRCDVCFFMRLKRAAAFAKANGFTRLSSVLGISRYKDFDQVCRAGLEVEAVTGVPYDTTDWRVYRAESAALSKEFGLYRQNYCGCKPREPKNG